jgi:hypothetical protein
MARVLTFQASTSRQIRHTVSHEPQTPYLRRFPFRVVAMQITAADRPLKKCQPGKAGVGCCRSSWEVCPRFQKSEFVARTALRTSRMGSLARNGVRGKFPERCTVTPRGVKLTVNGLTLLLVRRHQTPGHRDGMPTTLQSGAIGIGCPAFLWPAFLWWWLTGRCVRLRSSIIDRAFAKKGDKDG